MHARSLPSAIFASLLFAAATAGEWPATWDGDVRNLTVETLGEKYETYVLEDRAPEPLPAERYVRVRGKYLTLFVDDKAIFAPNYNAETKTAPLRRTDLVRFFEAPEEGFMFYRAAITVRTPFKNPNSNQVWFLEPDEQGSNLFHMAVDASESKSKPTFKFTVRSFDNVVWSAPVDLSTDNRFGILVKHNPDGSGVVYLFRYVNERFVCVAAETVEKTTPKPELHVGILIYGEPEPIIEGRDKITFSDVAVYIPKSPWFGQIDGMEMGRWLDETLRGMSYNEEPRGFGSDQGISNVRSTQQNGGHFLVPR